MTPPSLIQLGDVVDHQMQSRFVQSALHLHYGTALVATVLFCGDEDNEHALLCRPAPDETIDWLNRSKQQPPVTPPTRLDVGQALLERRALLPVSVTCEAIESIAKPSWGERGQFATYGSYTNDVAYVLVGADGRSACWVGKTLEAFDYDNLGSGLNG